MTPAVDEELDGVTDRGRNWSIQVCGHGCLHLSLDRLTVTLTPEEFDALLDLMRRARGRFHEPPAASAVFRSH